MMSEKQEYYMFYDEPLQPVRDGTHTIAIFNWQAVGYMSYDWCSYHWSILWGNRPGGSVECLAEREHAESGEIIPIDDGPIHVDPPINPTEGLNPPMYTRPDFIAVVVLVTTALIAITLWMLRRRRKRSET